MLTWGSDDELRAVEAISAATGGLAVIWPRCELQVLVALLSRVDMVVGCDTGPVHIAAALGTATVSLFRATDSKRSGPLGHNHRWLQTPMSCACCQLKQCDKNEECSTSIAVDDVYLAINDLVKNLNLKG